MTLTTGSGVVDAAASDAPEPGATGSAARSWARFVYQRLSVLLTGAIFLVVVSFLMIRLIPGDPVRASLGDNPEPAAVAAKRAELGLDGSLPSQFWDYVTSLVRLDFGTSVQTSRSVGPVLFERLGNTAMLALSAAVIVAIVAFGMGLAAAALTVSGRRRRTEASFNVLTGGLTAVPEFLLAACLVAIFSLSLGIFPASGMSGFGSLVLPAIALAAAPACFLARVVRLTTVNVLQRDYIVTARSKQLPTARMYLQHVLPNVLTGALTIGGLILGGLVGGSVIIEKVFAWPGIGAMVVDAIVSKDYAVVQGCVLVLGLIVLLINLAVDVVVAIVNPKAAGQ